MPKHALSGMSEAIPFRFERRTIDEADLLYVWDRHGDPVGYREMASGADHPRKPSDQRLLAALCDRHFGSHGSVPVTGGGVVPAVAETTSQPGLDATPAEADAVVILPATSEPRIQMMDEEPSADFAVLASAASLDEPPVAPWPRPTGELVANKPGEAALREAERIERTKPGEAGIAEAKSWRVGAQGEVRVAEILATVAEQDPRWVVLHSVPVGTRGSDIDHVVIGPGGIFTINAKHHAGAQVWVGGDTFLLNGDYKPYIRSSRFEAERAQSLLTAASGRRVSVTALVTVVGAHHVNVKAQPEDREVAVRVGIEEALADWLLNTPQIIDDLTLRAVQEAASWPKTWRARVSPPVRRRRSAPSRYPKTTVPTTPLTRPQSSRQRKQRRTRRRRSVVGLLACVALVLFGPAIARGIVDAATTPEPIGDPAPLAPTPKSSPFKVLKMTTAHDAQHRLLVSLRVKNVSGDTAYPSPMITALHRGGGEAGRFLCFMSTTPIAPRAILVHTCTSPTPIRGATGKLDISWLRE